jgi:serine/threonine-protein kinase
MENDGTILNNRYKLLQRAGTGGMASVYKAQDLMLGRLIAVKVLHESLTGNADFLRRFQQEAYSAANLSHPNIVTVHDIGQDGHYYYIVMEYIEGQTLKALIRHQLSTTGLPLNINRALDLAIEICAGVGYAHRANLVHCDVKSQNVLVTRDNRVKVADFGIARAMSQSLPGDDDLVWGTPQYFSPEQAAGENATPASDVYSIGVILFEMLTGRLPFEAENHAALAIKHMRETPPPVTRFNPAVPLQVERVIAKVLSKEPAGRYRTADQLGRILTNYRDNSLEDTGPLGKTGEKQPTAVPVAERITLY